MCPPPHIGQVSYLSSIHLSIGIAWVAELGGAKQMARACITGTSIYMRHKGPKPYWQRVLGNLRPPEADTFQMIAGGFWML